MSAVCKRRKQQSQNGRRAPSRTPAYNHHQCREKPQAALCSDDDWDSKCPSGCRLQGLITHVESEVASNMSKLCKMVKTYQDAAETSMTLTTHTYNANRRAFVNQYVADVKFVEYASALASNVTSLQKRSADLLQQLKEVVQRVQQQLADIYRTEVDVEMRLRACQGSCRTASPISVDHVGYQTFQTHMDQLDKSLDERTKAAATPANIPRIQVQLVDVNPAPSGEYKTIPTVQRELLTQFENIRQNHFVLDEPL